MKLASCAGFRAFVLAATCAAPLAGGAMAAEDWDSILAKAKQEGVVVVKGAPGTNYRAALVTAFNAAYPDIKVQFSGGAGAVEIPKVIRERQAGIYAWDVWIGGPTGALGQLKDTGFFQPLEPILRPEVKADDKWTGGFAAGWMDNDQKIFYGFDGTVQQTVQVNWDVVSRDSLKTLDDLLKPEFAGKIVWLDPRQTGTGNGTSQTILANLGLDRLVALYKHKVVYTKNPQQIGEWVVRGRYPIGIGLETPTLDTFQSQGVGTNVSSLPDEAYKVQQISVGFGGVGLVDRGPNINAATVYINWLLSKAGQEAWPRNSRRTDVEGAFPHIKPKPGKEYVMGQAEKFTDQRLQLLKVAKDAIGTGAP